MDVSSMIAAAVSFLMDPFQLRKPRKASCALGSRGLRNEGGTAQW
jgi:hypothetical protein